MQVIQKYGNIYCVWKVKKEKQVNCIDVYRLQSINYFSHLINLNGKEMVSIPLRKIALKRENSIMF